MRRRKRRELERAREGDGREERSGDEGEMRRGGGPYGDIQDAMLCSVHRRRG